MVSVEKDTDKLLFHEFGFTAAESVLSKLPKDYKSVLRQSSMSEEDDMGNLSFSEVRRQFRLCYFIFSFGLLCVSVWVVKFALPENHQSVMR